MSSKAWNMFYWISLPLTLAVMAGIVALAVLVS
jgi:hypothetical protein